MGEGITCAMDHSYHKLRPQFQRELDGKTTDLYLLENANGLAAYITNYGGKVVSLYVPDRMGKMADIVLGFSSLADYMAAEEKYHGAIIGRYGNRIARGEFSLDGQPFTLETNNPPNSLHGGPMGFHTVVWEAHQLDSQTLELKHFSPHGTEGFPGNLQVTVIYQLTNKNTLHIAYSATTDQKTVINLTHHSFFNLKGEGQGTINDHVMTIMADRFTPVNQDLIPTGELAPVAGTPFDFRKPTVIGDRLMVDHPQLQYGNGYDHNYVLNGSSNGQFALAARVYEPASGRMMEVFTDQPGMQFYGGNWLSGNDQGKSGRYAAQSAFCLETQHFPDSPNQPHFPSSELHPGELYTARCDYHFGIKN